MKRIFSVALLVMALQVTAFAQNELKKVYNEEINPLTQIDEAVTKAADNGKYVVCQVGGNWCIWCLRFADFISKDSDIDGLIKENFEYIHVNYNPRQKSSPELMQRLNNCGRFGYPVFVVLDEKGRVIHIQDSSFLEEGKGYDKDKVLRFFKAWTPKAVAP